MGWDEYDWLFAALFAAPVLSLALVKPTQIVGFKAIRPWCVADIVLLALTFYGSDAPMPDWASAMIIWSYIVFRFLWIPKLAMRMQAFGSSKWYALLALVFLDAMLAIVFLFGQTKEEKLAKADGRAPKSP